MPWRSSGDASRPRRARLRRPDPRPAERTLPLGAGRRLGLGDIPLLDRQLQRHRNEPVSRTTAGTAVAVGRRRAARCGTWVGSEARACGRVRGSLAARTAGPGRRRAKRHSDRASGGRALCGLRRKRRVSPSVRGESNERSAGRSSRYAGRRHRCGRGRLARVARQFGSTIASLIARSCSSCSATPFSVSISRSTSPFAQSSSR